MFQSIFNYFATAREELKKVTWPTSEETTKKTILVIIISLIVAIYIGLLDYFLNQVLEIFI